jgi:hypothetical protein
MAFTCEIFDGVKELEELDKIISNAPDRKKAIEYLKEETTLALNKIAAHQERLGIKRISDQWYMVDHEQDMLLYQVVRQCGSKFSNTNFDSYWEFCRAGEKFTILASHGIHKQIIDCKRLTEEAKAQGLNKHFSVLNINRFYLSGKKDYADMFPLIERKEEIFSYLKEALKLHTYTELCLYSPSFDPKTEVIQTLVDRTLLYQFGEPSCIYWEGEWIHIEIDREHRKKEGIQKEFRMIHITKLELPPHLMNRKEELLKDIIDTVGYKAAAEWDFGGGYYGEKPEVIVVTLTDLTQIPALTIIQYVPLRPPYKP